MCFPLKTTLEMLKVPALQVLWYMYMPLYSEEINNLLVDVAGENDGVQRQYHPSRSIRHKMVDVLPQKVQQVIVRLKVVQHQLQNKSKIMTHSMKLGFCQFNEISLCQQIWLMLNSIKNRQTDQTTIFLNLETTQLEF